MCVSSSDRNLVHGNREFYLPGELLLHGLHNVVRHEGFAVVLADVAVGHEAGFAAEVARKLAAVIILHDDGVPRVFQNFENCIAMQGHQPADLQLIGGNSLLIENLAGFLDHTFRGTPADQCNIGFARPPQHRRRNGSLNADDFAHALFHHRASLDRIGEFVANQYAVFHVFVGGGGVDVAGNAGDSARGNAALGNSIAFVIPVRGHCSLRSVAVGGGDEFSAIDWRAEIEIVWMYAESAFRQQQIAKHQARALEPVGEVENLRDELEAIADVQRSSNHSGIVTKCGAQHLPQVALLGLGGNAGGWTGSLAVDDDHRSFDHGGHAKAFAHQGEAPARRCTHGAHAGVSRADRHVDHTDLVFHLPDHNAGFARVRRHPVQNARRRTHWVGAIEFYAGC